MISEDSLDALEDILESMASIEEGLTLSEFDGFCAGLIVCPELIAPSEWLPVVWGKSKPPEFANEAAMQRTLDLIMAHYNEVASDLTPPDVKLAPIFTLDSNDKEMEVFWESWVCGFEQAMRLRPKVWGDIVESTNEDAKSAVIMMLELYNIADGLSELEDAQIDELTETAPELIPKLVFELNHWSKSMTQPEPFPSWARAANTPSAPIIAGKVGRNEPCPCGSGRKYKRCCGAN